MKWVIDARQWGNTLRFANHSSSTNCRVEILQVDGDHRVAILASQPLAHGEELFYDYHYEATVGGQEGRTGGPALRRCVLPVPLVSGRPTYFPLCASFHHPYSTMR